MSEELTQQRLREVLHYDPETGIFTWLTKIADKVSVGARAGQSRPNGYRAIGVLGSRHLEHRLAVLYMTGAWPAEEVDHVNGVRGLNSWENLRQCSHSENHQNRVARVTNTAGLAGASWHSQKKRWRSAISVAGKHHHLGHFNTPEEAHEAYKSAKVRLHPFNPELRA